MKEIRNLLPQEIEVRIGKVNAYGATLLLYKNARVDMDILDEVYGPLGWKREHSRDNRNCVVSVWNPEIQQWISKEDVGACNGWEDEKGVCSDSFKRACVNLGIGRSLYTAPKMFVFKEKLSTWKEEFDEKDGEVIPTYSCFDTFIVKNIEYVGKYIQSVKVQNLKTGDILEFNSDAEIPMPAIEDMSEKKKKTASRKKKKEEELPASVAEPIEVKTITEESEAESPVTAPVEEETSSPVVTETAEEETKEETEEDLPMPSPSKEETTEEVIPDDEILLFGNCLGMTYGEAKVTSKFVNFLKWVNKNPDKKYDREEQNVQFEKLKEIAKAV